jgi:hypothetical protein
MPTTNVVVKGRLNKTLNSSIKNELGMMVFKRKEME